MIESPAPKKLGKKKGIFYVGPPKEDIYLTNIYGLYFSHHYTFITDYNLIYDLCVQLSRHCFSNLSLDSWILLM